MIIYVLNGLSKGRTWRNRLQMIKTLSHWISIFDDDVSIFRCIFEDTPPKQHLTVDCIGTGPNFVTKVACFHLVT